MATRRTTDNRMSEQEKIHKYKKIKAEITQILQSHGFEQSKIDLFFSKSAAGSYLRMKVGQFFIENGVSEEEVTEMFKYI